MIIYRRDAIFPKGSTSERCYAYSRPFHPRWRYAYLGLWRKRPLRGRTSRNVSTNRACFVRQPTEDKNIGRETAVAIGRAPRRCERSEHETPGKRDPSEARGPPKSIKIKIFLSHNSKNSCIFANNKKIVFWNY